MKQAMILCSLMWFALASASHADPQSLSDAEVMQKIVERAKENDQLSDSHGYRVDLITKRLHSDGRVKEEDVRSYRTEWIKDKPRLELYKINHQNLTGRQRLEEARKRTKWEKALHNSEEGHRLGFTWEELYEKYDFALLPANSDSGYVLSFRPKQGKLQQRNRLEKILNHLSGKLWVDENFNMIRVKAQLAKTVSFGLGFLARVEEMEFDYSQTAFQNVWLPHSLHINVRAKFALLKTERRAITARFLNYFTRPEGEKIQAAY